VKRLNKERATITPLRLVVMHGPRKEEICPQERRGGTSQVSYFRWSAYRTRRGSHVNKQVDCAQRVIYPSEEKCGGRKGCRKGKKVEAEKATQDIGTQGTDWPWRAMLRGSGRKWSGGGDADEQNEKKHTKEEGGARVARERESLHLI